jgi:hypothetical protein
MKIIALLCLTFVLTSCTSAHVVWNHRSGTNDVERFAQDKYVCIQESRTQASGVYIGRGAMLAQAFAQIEAQEQANRLFTLCMEARGWSGQLVRQ